MKKTIYFTSQQKAPNLGANLVEESIKAVSELRDEFILNNSDTIAKVDSESIQFVTWQNDNYIIAIIQLNYYLK